jgi:hypothetical protein
MKKIKRYTWLTLIVVCSPIAFSSEIITRLSKIVVDEAVNLLFWVPYEIVGAFYYGIPQKWEELKKLWERAKKETE